jgi:hypothetical protein
MNQQSSRPKIMLTSFKQRSNGAISPVFGWLVLFMLWFGAFIILGISEGNSLAARLVFPTVLTLMALVPGLFLFQSYDLKVTTHSVTWESTIIPVLCVEHWEEPISRYKSISLKQTKPVLGFIPPKYCADTALYPERITGDNLSKANKAFNEKKFVVVYLEHSSDKKKNVGLKVFDSAATAELGDYLAYAEEKLGLPVNR